MAHVASYSHITIATIPRESWDDAWFAIESWKGYLQSFPGLLGIRLSARPLHNGDVRFHVSTVWEYPEQLDVWRRSQWSADSLLGALEQPAYDIEAAAYEDIG